MGDKANFQYKKLRENTKQPTTTEDPKELPEGE